MSRGSDRLVYDEAHRLVCYQANSTTCTTATATATYTYNGDGLRWTTTTNASTRYWVTGIDTMVLDDGGYKYVYGLGLAYGVDSLGNTLTQHTDGLGSVRAETDTSGNVVQTYGTDEFGIVDAALTSGTQPTPFQYTGEPRDSETGLVYLRARSYDPAVGRFMQADPLRKSGPGIGGWNRYSYAGNNPVTSVDPSGLRTYFVGGIGGSASPAYGAFLQALVAARVIGVQPAATAFDEPTLGAQEIDKAANAARVAAHAYAPALDSDAVRLKSRILQDLEARPLAWGEQLNLIGYSGGATVTLNAAFLLHKQLVPIDNLVSIGGVTFLPSPDNVGSYSAIIGSNDAIAPLSTVHADSIRSLAGVGHTDYFESALLDTVRIVLELGVR